MIRWLLAILTVLVLCLPVSHAAQADYEELFFLTHLEEADGKLLNIGGDIIRDWAVIAEEEVAGITYRVFHILALNDGSPEALALFERLQNHATFLGKTYKAIAQRAKAGNAVCVKVIKRIVFTCWEVAGEDYRGTLGEWITAGKPTRTCGWQPAHQWLGHEDDTVLPDDEDLE